jgi:hypothetical protein
MGACGLLLVHGREDGRDRWVTVPLVVLTFVDKHPEVLASLLSTARSTPPNPPRASGSTDAAAALQVNVSQVRTRRRGRRQLTELTDPPSTPPPP